MDKLSEYIPIIIILISVVFSIIGKAKKTVKATQETMLPGKAVEEAANEKKQPQMFTGSYPKVFEGRPKKQTFSKPEVKKEVMLSHIPTSPTNIILESEEEESTPFSIEGEDDIKKAIIYSEIINRKEW